MSKEDMQRTLCAEFPGAFIELNTGVVPPVLEIDGIWGPWRDLTGGFFLCQQDIDLSGYAMDKKTFYPYTSFEQRGSATSGKFATTLNEQPYVIDYTICSSIPLQDNDLGAALTGLGFILPSGFLPGTGRINREVIIHGESKTYTIDSTLAVAGDNNVLRLIDSQTFSSLEPTAADKIYCYRLIGLTSRLGEGLTATLPPVRILLPGNISSEPKLEYMMRLKRSYELANQV